MNPAKIIYSGANAFFRVARGAVFIAFCLLEFATMVAAPFPSPPTVTLTDGVLQFRLPDHHDVGWILQKSSDLTAWASLGDPVKIAPRFASPVELPFQPVQPQSFFRAVPANRLARESLLHEQWRHWKTAGLHTYEFEFRWICFCVPEFTQWVRIAVADGTIVSVRSADDGHHLPTDWWSRYYTLDGLLGLLDEAFTKNAARVEVTYDAGYGYPQAGYIDYYEMMADDEKEFQVRFPPPATALILSEQPASWPGDPYVIEYARREGDWLQFEVAYSGGCVDPHGWELTVVPAPSEPGKTREILCYLTHDARGDTCEAYLRKRLTFGLSSLRAWWATGNPVLGHESARLILVIQNPPSKIPETHSVLDYAWDPAVFVPWRDVVNATSQRWYGGVFSSGNGVDYQLVLRFPAHWGGAIQVRTLWIDGRAFSPEVQWLPLAWGGERLATLRATFREVPRLDPDHPGQVLGVDEIPPLDPQAPVYTGAALLVTETLGQTQEWSIPNLHALPSIYYP